MRRQKKTRTREHIIASQSVAHLEHFVFACGFTAERIQHDYGYDLNIYTYDAEGGVENGSIYVQLKATDALTTLADNETIVQVVDNVDIQFWSGELMPVMLVVYDAQRMESYWLYVQKALEAFAPLSDPVNRNTVTLRLSKSNKVGEQTMEQWRSLKSAILAQKGVISHGG